MNTALTPAVQDDDGIPVLTDVVDAAADADHAELEITQRLAALTAGEQATQSASPPSGFTPATYAALAHPATDAPPDDAWLEELSVRIHSRVLDGLTARIDPIVEARLKESLADLLEQVLAGMTAELKVTARRIVRDAVAQAVAAELAQLHAPGVRQTKSA